MPKTQNQGAIKITPPVNEDQRSPLRHLLTGEELNPPDIENLIQHALKLKHQRKHKYFEPSLAGHHLALLFDKPSLRTRFSFTVAMHELNGHVIESVGSTRKSETPADQARVLAGYCDAIMIRTFDDQNIVDMAHASSIPVINGLSDLHHPCQILSDLLTLYEVFGSLQGLSLSYIGDGNNVLHSLLLLAPQMGIDIHYCCPAERGPRAEIVERAVKKQTIGTIKKHVTPAAAVAQAHAVYTDVWASMGFEAQSADHLFDGFQVNEKLMQHALPNAIFMHCLPMERGKEVSQTLPDSRCSVIFQQSENRLHMQKALLLHLIKGI